MNNYRKNKTIDYKGVFRDVKGKFIKGIHYSPETEFRSGQPPNNFGKGVFKNGHPGYNKKSNSGSFKKGQQNKNKGKKELWDPNKGSFQKGQIFYWRGKRRIEILGENHPNWKGGVTKLAEKIRKDLKYKQWRSEIFQRDNWNCQFCGRMGDYLNVHHYHKEFYQILEENNIKTMGHKQWTNIVLSVS